MANRRLRYHVKEIFKRADAVCFDVDSTLIRDEGIDRLAESCGVGEEVEALTKTAMAGAMGYRESLQSRLDIIQPSLKQVNELKDEQLADIDNVLTPGIRELVSLLHQRHTSVYVISGGFRQLIEPIVEVIGIPNKKLYCNKLLFDDSGEYAGFDEKQLTCQNGGKGQVMAEIKKAHDIVVMVGDGMTDYETCPPADTFIGFGGNVERLSVKEVAPWYIYNMRDLIDVLETQSDDDNIPPLTQP